MRVRFAEQTPVAVEAEITTFWNEFTRAAPDIARVFKREGDFDLVGFMHRFLRPIEPRLMWEFGPGLRGARHRLCLCPEANYHLHPLAELVVARAPAGTGFEFYVGRQPEAGLTWVDATVEGRTNLSVEGWKLSIQPTEDLGLMFHVIPRREQLAEERINEAAVIAVEALLGESFLNTYCDGIDVASSASDAVDLDAAKPLIERLLEGHRASLPSAAFTNAEGQDAVLFELHPARDEARPLHDVLIAWSIHPVMLRNTRRRSFSSLRFSRFNETFAYVMLEDPGPLDQRLAKRNELIDALTAGLDARAMPGAVIGGATGLRYSYVELASTHPEALVPGLRELLRKSGAPQTTWLCFHDATLRAEWVGLSPDTPPPPHLPG